MTFQSVMNWCWLSVDQLKSNFFKVKIWSNFGQNSFSPQPIVDKGTTEQIGHNPLVIGADVRKWRHEWGTLCEVGDWQRLEAWVLWTESVHSGPNRFWWTLELQNICDLWAGYVIANQIKNFNSILNFSQSVDKMPEDIYTRNGRIEPRGSLGSAVSLAPVKIDQSWEYSLENSQGKLCSCSIVTLKPTIRLSSIESLFPREVKVCLFKHRKSAQTTWHHFIITLFITKSARIPLSTRVILLKRDN